MDNMSKKEWIKSLFFSVIAFLWGTAALMTGLLLGNTHTAFSFVYISGYIIAISGGILSMLLTILLHINTSRYFFKRLIVVVIICVIFQVLMSFFIPTIFILVLEICGVVYQIVKVQDEDTSPGERAVLILSDPLVYWSINQFINLVLSDILH